MMISGANCLILDEPTNHLDMESITALNNGLIKYPGVTLFACRDHQFVQTTANRIMEILSDGTLIDKITTYDEYLASDAMARKRTFIRPTRKMTKINPMMGKLPSCTECFPFLTEYEVISMHTVDLHVHSTKSDGSLSPSQLVDLAGEKGLDAFALTDHDTIDGLDEAIEYNSGNSLEIIPGIEFSTEYMGKDIHILGLFIDYKMPSFRRQIQAFVDSRILRNEKMCRNLQEAGIDISFDKLKEAFPGSVITRGHYARYLLEHGYIKSLPEAFERYVGDRCRYFVPREKVTPEQAVHLILDAKGLPILAHPTLYHMGKDALQTLVARLKKAGLVGIEAVYSTYSPREEREMKRLAEKNELLISGGSDFHGKSKPGLEMATGYGKLQISADILEALRLKRKELFDE